MASRRGLFAEMQHQAQVAARQADQRRRAAVAAERRVLTAQRAEQLLIASSMRALEADRKRLDREIALAHAAAMQAEVDERNGQLALVYDELDGLLKSTLSVDDFVDLALLKREVEHPPFERADLEKAIPEPAQVVAPVEPVLQVPSKPTGLFGRKKKAEEAQSQAEADLRIARRAWEAEVASLPSRQARAVEEHRAAESGRVAELQVERDRYAKESVAREAEVAEHNAAVDKFIADLSYGSVEAVKEYVNIVLANSLYPEHFEVAHDADFDASTAELTVRAIIPGPDLVPTVKAYKYTKSTDDIGAVSLTQKDMKARYASVVQQVALRTLHEVFEADRRGIIQSISLEVGTETTSPATGKSVYIPFVAVGAFRESFVLLDLANVIPQATLDHLGGAVSRSPFDLVPASVTGVRRS